MVAFQNDSDDEYREDDFEASPVPISAGPPTLGVHHTPGSYAHLLTRKTPPDWPHIGVRPTCGAGRGAFVLNRRMSTSTPSARHHFHTGERPHILTRAGRDAFKELRLDVVAAAWAAEKARGRWGPRRRHGRRSAPVGAGRERLCLFAATAARRTDAAARGASPNDGISALLSRRRGDRGGLASDAPQRSGGTARPSRT